MTKSKAGTGEVASASATAAHLDCTRSYLDKLEAAGVIQRAKGGFNLAAARVGYIRHLRTVKSRSPKNEAEEAFLKQKTVALEVRTMQRLNKLVPVELLNESIDVITGLYRAELASLPARFTRDIRERHRLDGLIREMLKRIANEAFKRAERIEAALGNGKAEAFGLGATDADA